ncbi:MAG: SRPBCC domain-containing protein [Myxococcales bacterium]|nr:SRPBCC domain-containing protein [Myxococcales bacterium]MCB9669351.1 SRPBCC domain-containing protein [Alphaproteobacteria bacterium]MCB9690383.1 SRPBCC domain-containing protein [Alphaproteobacteria bacterium]
MPSVRQQINIAASPRAVWKQLTTAEGLSSWWADEARVDASQGGRLVLTSEDDEGNPLEERGTFIEARPTRKLEIKWDPGSPGPTAGSRVKFQLARDGEETRVSVVHSGAFLDEEEVFARFDKEWKSALKALRSSLED